MTCFLRSHPPYWETTSLVFHLCWKHLLPLKDNSEQTFWHWTTVRYRKISLFPDPPGWFLFLKYCIKTYPVFTGALWMNLHCLGWVQGAVSHTIKWRRSLGPCFFSKLCLFVKGFQPHFTHWSTTWVVLMQSLLQQDRAWWGSASVSLYQYGQVQPPYHAVPLLVLIPLI